MGVLNRSCQIPVWIVFVTRLVVDIFGPFSQPLFAPAFGLPDHLSAGAQIVALVGKTIRNNGPILPSGNSIDDLVEVRFAFADDDGVFGQAQRIDSVDVDHGGQSTGGS